ncbi:biotin transporter BioY [Lactococcus insecticola]|uniref:Biotin transporter n=1 Tax=Pseudolactococcus insecticola TaxID=2709158 RepID=A0A6A0B5Q1_9LACT|nr:biotin transporter BioY [Lactococcus insecticola]GFH40562.1 biotin synthesis protein BioY [Lactococcus insecticola]
MNQSKVQRLAIIAVAAAFLVVASQVTIPLPLVPLTLQTLAVGIIATVLKPLDSIIAILLYLILGAIGLPVFAGGAAGFGALFGPTGGFLIGFLLQAQQTAQINRMAVMVKSDRSKLFVFIIANIIGALWCLALGTIWLSVVANLSLKAGFNAGFLPFIIPGLVKAILAAAIGFAIRRALKSNRYFATPVKSQAK